MTRALLVDDDRDLARLLTEYLATHEVEVTHVENGPVPLPLRRNAVQCGKRFLRIRQLQPALGGVERWVIVVG